jgi:chromosome segregation ATPase
MKRKANRKADSDKMDEDQQILELKRSVENIADRTSLLEEIIGGVRAERIKDENKIEELEKQLNWVTQKANSLENQLNELKKQINKANDTTAAETKNGGRPKDEVWKLFTLAEKSGEFKCNKCKRVLKLHGRVDRAKAHLMICET